MKNNGAKEKVAVVWMVGLAFGICYTMLPTARRLLVHGAYISALALCLVMAVTAGVLIYGAIHARELPLQKEDDGKKRWMVTRIVLFTVVRPVVGVIKEVRGGVATVADTTATVADVGKFSAKEAIPALKRIHGKGVRIDPADRGKMTRNAILWSLVAAFLIGDATYAAIIGHWSSCIGAAAMAAPATLIAFWMLNVLGQNR